MPRLKSICSVFALLDLCFVFIFVFAFDFYFEVFLLPQPLAMRLSVVAGLLSTLSVVLASYVPELHGPSLRCQPRCDMTETNKMLQSSQLKPSAP
jgi:hypothetical protein